MMFRPFCVRYPGQQLRRDLNLLMSGLSGSLDEWWPMAGSSRPAVNLWESTDTVHVELEVPGVKNGQVDISAVGNELSVKIERPNVEQQDVTYHRRERPVGMFTRVIRLPVDVSPDKVEAELRHGVLTIHLPKAEAARPRKIQVTSVS